MWYLAWLVATPRCHATATRPVRNSRTRLCDAAHFLCSASCHTLHHPLTRWPSSSATAGNRHRNLCAPTSKRAPGNLSTYAGQRTSALVGSHIIPPVDTTPHKQENRQSVRWHGGGGEIEERVMRGAQSGSNHRSKVYGQGGTRRIVTRQLLQLLHAP